MSRVCDICGKGVQTGGHIIHRGLSKKSGGIGLQLVKTNLRKFMPNLQSVRIVQDGVKKRAKVCTACIRSNKVVKA
ncbi:MAG: large ribosomal subunit protein bL28 [Lentisphaeria bacterium]